MQTRSYRPVNQSKSQIRRNVELEETSSHRFQETKRYQVNVVPSEEKNNRNTRSNKSTSATRSNHVVNSANPKRSQTVRRRSAVSSEKDTHEKESGSEGQLSRTATLSRSDRKKRIRKEKSANPIYTGFLIVGTVLWALATLGLVYLKYIS
jgi:hypothetical protein